MHNNIIVRLYKVVTRTIELKNPHSKGLKKLYRDIFPLTKEETVVVLVKYIAFEKIEEIYSYGIAVNGSFYLRTSEGEPYDSGDGWTSYRPLYILQKDFEDILHGDYTTHISRQEEVSTNED